MKTIVLALGLLAVLAASAAEVTSAKIVLDGKAKDNGEIKVAVTPVGGEKKEISVTVAAKMGKSEVARDLTKELKVALGEGFQVDQYDDDKIKVESKSGKVAFTLEIAGSSVPGLSVAIK